jgi:hypothetical protein
MTMELLRTGAIKRVAILARMTKVPMARIARMAFTGLRAHYAVRTVQKPLELDGGEGILRQQACE